MPIGQRIANGEVVPLRKVRAATAEALNVIDQHAAVLNEQRALLKAHGRLLADLTTRVETLEAAKRQTETA